ncbi:MAG: DUF1501 domain-containing protein [Acidimicrobiia bacterium]|nr:DUF1501 domain-containing protein [Acidimicrobiia bacterium]
MRYRTFPNLTRREWLQAMSAFSALASVVERGRAQETSIPVTPRSTARVCIFINMDGAPSHLDTFDVKDAEWNAPDVALEQHGPIVLSRTFFPQLSGFTSDLCLLRSVSSWEAEHTRGQFYLQTAHPANPAFLAETPHIGAVTALELARDARLPPFLTLNGRSGQGATFLGGRFEPLEAPANPGGFSTIQHNFYGNRSQTRFEEKYKMLRELEAPLLSAPFDPLVATQGAYYEAARQLMYDEAVANVFRFSNEDNERYGNTNFGRACIIARNAVRARSGVAYINIFNGGWDTHQSMFDTRYPNNFYTLCNILDSGVGPLIRDLTDSGHLSETLIVMMGEFGRTPGPLNTRGGRDHHRSAMSVAMLGGGVRGGRVIGATDANGERVIEPGWHKQRSIYPEDIVATIYSALGINWTKRITDTPTGRLFEYVPHASRGDYVPVQEVFG